MRVDAVTPKTDATEVKQLMKSKYNYINSLCCMSSMSVEQRLRLQVYVEEKVFHALCPYKHGGRTR